MLSNFVPVTSINIACLDSGKALKKTKEILEKEKTKKEAKKKQKKRGKTSSNGNVLSQKCQILLVRV